MINYEKSGTGKEHIILIHAFPLDGRMWAKQVEALKNDFTLLVPDLRGFGKNATKETFFYTIDSYSDDILQIIENEKLDKVILCGLSIGGYITLRCMQKFPERISRIILADTKAENDDNNGLIGRAATITKLQDGKKNEVTAGLLKKLVCKNTLENKPQVVEDIQLMMDEQSATGMASAVAALGMRINSKDHLKDIKTPALIIIGEEDELTPPAFSVTLNENIGGSRMHIIKNAGHLSNMEQPEDFNKAVINFLQEK